MDFKDLKHLSFELSANVMPQYGENIKDTKENLGLNIPLDELVETIRIPNEKHMKNAIAQINGIKTSENAGRHMCETIFRDLIRLSNRGKRFQPSFIHVPHTPDLLTTSVQLDEHKKSMSLEEQKAIIEAVIKRIGNFYL
jgi:pyrrolidone-carboxylate peptidase